MSYIGNSLQNQNYIPAVDFFNGDGSTTAFTLSRPVASVAQVQAVISNVPQNPGSAFTVLNSTITFTSAPPSGTSNIYVYYTSPNNSLATLPQSPTFLGTATFGNALSYGASGLLASFASNTNGYNQVVSQNASNGASASSDFIVSNDQGTDSTNYGDFGINSSGYSGSGPFSIAGGVYNYAQSGAMSVGTAGAQPLIFGTNNTEQARVDSSGNVVIGSTTADGKLSVYTTNGHSRIYDNGSDENINIRANNGLNPSITFTEITQADRWTVGCYAGNGALAFRLGASNMANGTEAMRIGSSGVLFVSTTINSWSDCTATFGCLPTHTTGQLIFQNSSNGLAGYINYSGSTTTYNSGSDYRMKEDVQPMVSGIDTVMRLKPCTWKWKEGFYEDNQNGQGFIAHELQEVVPDCVTGEKDAVNDDGVPMYQGVDTSFLVATLTKAIQELKAELDATKAEVAALKGGK